MSAPPKSIFAWLRRVHCRLAGRASAVLLAAALVSVRVAFAEEPPPFLLQWGGLGSGPGQFRSPGSIVGDGTGHVYVVDGQNHRVQKFDEDGTFIMQWGSEGSGDGQFLLPIGIAIDGAGTVYVTDGQRRSVEKFKTDGTFLGRFSTGDRPPNQVAIDPMNTFLYYTSGQFVDKYTVDGAFVTSWDAGVSPVHSNNEGIAVSSSGEVYVAAEGDNRIKVYSPLGAFLREFGTDGFRGVAIGPGDSIYATDPHCVFKLTPTGDQIWRFGGLGSGDGEFITTQDLWVSDTGDVFVLDIASNNVEKFGDSPTATTDSWGRLKLRYLTAGHSK